MKKPIYLDYNATTPVDPIVLEKMLPFFTEKFGNSSSVNHAYGWEAENAVKSNRKSIAKHLGAKSKEIIFTSGATESNNLALIGYMFNFLCPSNGCKETPPPHLITTQVEHKCVMEVGQLLQKWGAEVTFLKPDHHGMIHPEQVQNAIQSNTKIVSVIFANNEIGTINPIEAIGEICKKQNIVFHTDAAQAVGKIPIDVNKLNIDMLSLSGHKIYGPKGIGALYVRGSQPEINLQPFMVGGSQEGGVRPGTLNVPGIVGLGAALDICIESMGSESKKIANLRDYIVRSLLDLSPNIQLNGHPEKRLYGNASFSFKNLNADLFALGLSGIAVSSGSACSSAQAKPSYVLKAIGHSDSMASATIRIGLGRFTLKSEVDFVIEKVKALLEKNDSL